MAADQNIDQATLPASISDEDQSQSSLRLHFLLTRVNWISELRSHFCSLIVVHLATSTGLPRTSSVWVFDLFLSHLFNSHHLSVLLRQYQQTVKRFTSSIISCLLTKFIFIYFPKHSSQCERPRRFGHRSRGLSGLGRWWQTAYNVATHEAAHLGPDCRTRRGLLSVIEGNTSVPSLHWCRWTLMFWCRPVRLVKSRPKAFIFVVRQIPLFRVATSQGHRRHIRHCFVTTRHQQVCVKCSLFIFCILLWL